MRWMEILINDEQPLPLSSYLLRRHEVTGSDSLCWLLVFFSLFRFFSVKPPARFGVCFGGQPFIETKVLLSAANIDPGTILDQLTAFTTSRHFILLFRHIGR